MMPDDTKMLSEGAGITVSRWAQIRRLKVQARLRGTREACLLLGRLADGIGSNPDNRLLCDFEMLLKENDCDIVHWALGSEEPPQEFRLILSRLAHESRDIVAENTKTRTGTPLLDQNLE